MFRERYKRSVLQNVLRSIIGSLQIGCFEEAGKGRRLTAIEAAEVNRYQGAPWSKELDGKELRGAAGGEYDQKLRESASLCISSTRSQPAVQSSTNVV